jgi:DtxR family Mn-dependent transcriptional regulator
MLTLEVAAILLVGLALFVRKRVLRRGRRGRERQRRILIEDALKHVHVSQHRGSTATPESLAGALNLPRRQAVDLVGSMESARLVRATGGGILLTATGHALALQVIRAHRIWERYLTDEVGAPLPDIHTMAEAREHELSANQVDALDAHLGHPRYDPHGDPIPTAAGDLAPREATPLTEWPPNRPGRIAHIEDEPPSVFAQILSEGLLPGIDVEVLDGDGGALHLRTSTHECWLPRVVAAGILVSSTVPESKAEPLSALPVGARAVVAALKCQGLVRRRFMDLGLTPGAVVRAIMSSALGDPVAYEVRGTLVALRADQAAQILVRPLAGERAAEAPEGSAR